MLAELDGAKPPTVLAEIDNLSALTVALVGPLAVRLVIVRLAEAEPPLTWFSSLSVSSIITSTTLPPCLGMPECYASWRFAAGLESAEQNGTAALAQLSREGIAICASSPSQVTCGHSFRRRILVRRRATKRCPPVLRLLGRR